MKFSGLLVLTAFFALTSPKRGDFLHSQNRFFLRDGLSHMVNLSDPELVGHAEFGRILTLRS